MSLFSNVSQQVSAEIWHKVWDQSRDTIKREVWVAIQDIERQVDIQMVMLPVVTQVEGQLDNAPEATE
jgi:hypothetical protein